MAYSSTKDLEMAVGFWKGLWNRRVPHIIGIYLGISWALLEFVGFVVDQYVLSPHLVTVSLIALASMLPSVVVVAYFHGKPGRQGWTRIEMVAVPSNLVAVLVLLVLMFSGKDLGAATTVVSVTDEEGIETERVIPKSEFRKRIAIFNFDAPPGDTASAWLGYGLPQAIVEDLSQDLWITFNYAPMFRERLQEAGFRDLAGVPLALQRQVAEELHQEYFLAGGVNRERGQIRADLTLYDAEDGRSLGEHHFQGPNVLVLADQITEELRYDMRVPDLGGRGVQDLPVSQVTTDSPEAFRAYARGMRAMLVQRDNAAAATFLEEATALDPTFATAQFALAQAYYISNRSQEALAPLQAAMDHEYRIVERARFQLRSDYYFLVRQDIDRALAALEMWSDLFPDDIVAYRSKIQIQNLRGDQEGILASLEKILELDPAQRDVLLRMGDLHLAMGHADLAREVFLAYAEEFPESREALMGLARASRMEGDLEAALSHYDRALVLAPSDVGAMVGMGNTLRAMGDFAGAVEHLGMASATAGTPEERAQAHGALGELYGMRGQTDREIEELESRLAEEASFRPEVQSAMIRLRLLPEALMRAGREAEALAEIERGRSQLQTPFDAFLALGELGIQVGRNDADGIEAALPGLEGAIEAFQSEALRPILIHARGRMHELRGEYQLAIEAYEEEEGLNPADSSIPTRLGRCFREIGEYGRGVALLREALLSAPWAPEANFELGLTYEAMGRPDEARTHLERAMEVWADADEGFSPAQEVREALARLGDGSQAPVAG